MVEVDASSADGQEYWPPLAWMPAALPGKKLISLAAPVITLLLDTRNLVPVIALALAMVWPFHEMLAFVSQTAKKPNATLALNSRGAKFNWRPPACAWICELAPPVT